MLSTGGFCPYKAACEWRTNLRAVILNYMSEMMRLNVQQVSILKTQGLIDRASKGSFIIAWLPAGVGSMTKCLGALGIFALECINKNLPFKSAAMKCSKDAGECRGQLAVHVTQTWLPILIVKYNGLA